jgi:hypothetical protein
MSITDSQSVSFGLLTMYVENMYGEQAAKRPAFAQTGWEAFEASQTPVVLRATHEAAPA